LSYIIGGLRQYFVGFLAEIGLFWLALLAFQAWSGMVRWEFTGGLGLPVVAIAMASSEWNFRLYRRVWAVAGLPDALAIIGAVVQASFVVLVIDLMLPDPIQPYRPLAIIAALPAAIGAIGLFRLFSKVISLDRRNTSRLLVVAPGTWANPIVKSLIEQRSSGWSPVAILTTDESMVHRTVTSVPVVGQAQDLKHWLEVLHIEGVAFVSAENGLPDWRGLLKICLNSELPVFMVAGPREWLGNGVGRLRQLTADDLVGRSDRTLEIEVSRELVEDRTVIITGAAGSIGSEICRCLAMLRPRRLVLLDNNESGLFDIVEELRLRSTAQIREALVSIQDVKQLVSVFADERPDIVFHAAAYKHVPMLESHPLQAVMTNVLGTWNVLSCAEAAGTAKLILISTDKAVAQHSVMGCSKRLCELMVLTHRGTTSAWGVRFGNVVGSRGSVVPLFERQIDMGGPVTITHPEATRYLMTKREAASLTIATLPLAKANQLFMLDMGEPVQILRLAEALIRARGLRPETDIEIIFTGLRPGEVVTERLFGPEEAWRPTSHPSVKEVIATQGLMDAVDLQWVIEHLRALAEDGQADAVVSTLRRATSQPLPVSIVDLAEAQPTPTAPTTADRPG
jgi:FlaA1/EpsC-like NDP-sugar epimerase